MGRPTRYIDLDVNRFFQQPGIKVIDLFCCSGLAAEGIMRTGVKVLGIDINTPSYYPGTFMQADVTQLPLSFIKKFDWGWASPPCQFASRGAANAIKKGKQYPNHIPYTRELLTASGVPFVMENIPEAGIRPDFMLCGSMFGLPQWRHRHFECINWQPVYQKLYCNHATNKGNNHSIAGSFRGTVHDAAESMGCYPTRLRSEIKEGIPPAYSEFIFKVWLQMYGSALTNSLELNKCLDR
jgi:DNA (cytosine-5)-methyltransferase 1